MTIITIPKDYLITQNQDSKSTTYRLKASKLDQNFLDTLKTIYGDQEIVINVSSLTTQLENMALDPDIQSEIEQIEQEFKITEMDGLTNL
ncbi:MAG TPA: hypothetical protein V6C58_18450 [Allocoleopsis sp.]